MHSLFSLETYFSRRHQRVGDEEAGGAPSPLQSLPYETRRRRTKPKASKNQPAASSSSQNRGEQLQNASDIEQIAVNSNGNGAAPLQGGQPTSAVATEAHDQEIALQQNNQQTNGGANAGVNESAAPSTAVEPESTQRPAKNTNTGGAKKKAGGGRKRKRSESVIEEISEHEDQPVRKSRLREQANLGRTQEDLFTGSATIRSSSPGRRADYKSILDTLLWRDDPNSRGRLLTGKPLKQLALKKLDNGALKLANKNTDGASPMLIWVDALSALTKIDEELDAGTKRRHEAHIRKQRELTQREREVEEREKALEEAKAAANRELNDHVDKTLQAYHDAIFAGARITIEPEDTTRRDRAGSYERLRPVELPSTPSRSSAEEQQRLAAQLETQTLSRVRATQSDQSAVPQTEPPRTSRFSFRAFPSLPKWIPSFRRSTATGQPSSSSDTASSIQNQASLVGTAVPQSRPSLNSDGDTSAHLGGNIPAPLTESHEATTAQSILTDQSGLAAFTSIDNSIGDIPIPTKEPHESVMTQSMTVVDPEYDPFTSPTPRPKTRTMATTESAEQTSQVSALSKGKGRALPEKRKADDVLDLLTDFRPSLVLNDPKRRKLLEPPTLSQEDLPLTRDVLGNSISFTDFDTSLSQSNADNHGAEGSTAAKNKYGFQVSIDEYISRGIERAAQKLDRKYARTTHKEVKRIDAEQREELNEEYALKYKQFLAKLPFSIEQCMDAGNKIVPQAVAGMSYHEQRAVRQVMDVAIGVPANHVKRRRHPRIGDPELPVTTDGKIPRLKNGGYGMNLDYFVAYDTDGDSDPDDIPPPRPRILRRRMGYGADVAPSPKKSALRKGTKYSDAPPTSANIDVAPTSSDSNEGAAGPLKPTPRVTFSVPFGSSSSEDEEARKHEGPAGKQVSAQATRTAKEEAARAEQMRVVKEKADFVSQQKFRPQTPSKLSAMSKASPSPQSSQDTTPTAAATATSAGLPSVAGTLDADEVMDLFESVPVGAFTPFAENW